MNFSNDIIIHIIGEKLDYIQFKRLLEYENILTHAYTLRDKKINFGPNLNYDEYTKNYSILCNELNLNTNNIIRPYQKHTSNVKEIIEKKSNKLDYNSSYLDETDGLITSKKEIILSTTNADCILFLLFDPIKKVIANVHSGWRGTLEQIIIKTVKKMKDNYNCNLSDIICCISPSIRKCHFEVDTDVKDLFYNKFSYLSNINEIIEQTENKYHIDTVLLNKTLLLNIGLKEKNIIDSNICSVCYSKYINSYRVDKEKYKLSTAIITLK